MFNNNSTNILEWDLILDEIAKRASSDIGKDLCRELEFSSSYENALELQEQVSETIFLLDMEGKIPLGGIRDIYNDLDILRKGGIPQKQAFLDISSTLRAVRIIKKFVTERLKETSVLYDLIYPLYTNHAIEDKIEQTFSPDGNILDSASPKLLKIRNSIREIQISVKEKLIRIIQDPKHRNIIQETIITQRNNRYVIPVKAESQGHIKGILHDQSLSGATVYIEPMSVVDDNNKLAKKILEEKAEIEIILRELANHIIPDIEMIWSVVDTLAVFDVIVAKAEYCLYLNAKKPHLNKTGLVDLYKVKHPVLISQKGADNVIPTDILLGRTFDTLVITGSNTGGKTVTLKTLGLCALMVKIGLYLPTKMESDMAYFDKVLADIGDEQDLKQNLSTFSGHLTNINRILNKADENSLILIDEIGTGTDPDEGTAVAQSIIEFLMNKKAKTVVTTHYGKLKTLSYNYENISNASVEFNIETLSPTYRLLLGIPGKSNAIHIAKRIGLADDILDRAKELLGEKQQDITDSIDKMEKEYQMFLKERTKYEEMNSELTDKETKFNQKFYELELKSKKIKDEVYKEFELNLEEELEKVRNIVRDLQKDKTLQNAEKTRKSIKNIESNAQQKHKKGKEAIKPITNSMDNIKKGDYFLLQKINQIVQVTSDRDKSGNVEVLAGNIKLTVNVSELNLLEGKEMKQKLKNIKRINPSIKIKVQEKQSKGYRNTFNECDLRGLYVEDCLERVEKFLDDSSMLNTGLLYLIHGGGTGALKRAVRDYLAKNRYVASFRSGSMEEGGDGVTVVTLKG